MYYFYVREFHKNFCTYFIYIIFQVFSYLCEVDLVKCAMVSRRFNQLSNDNSVWLISRCFIFCIIFFQELKWPLVF